MFTSRNIARKQLDTCLAIPWACWQEDTRTIRKYPKACLYLCRFGLPEGRTEAPDDEREALFMLDSGAGGADAMMNFSSGTDLGLIDPRRESGISTTVRVSAFPYPFPQGCELVLTRAIIARISGLAAVAMILRLTAGKGRLYASSCWRDAACHCRRSDTAV